MILGHRVRGPSYNLSKYFKHRDNINVLRSETNIADDFILLLCIGEIITQICIYFFVSHVCYASQFLKPYIT